MSYQRPTFFLLFMMFSVVSSTLIELDVSPFAELFQNNTVYELKMFNVIMYKNNTMERLQPDNVPPSLHSKTGVQSKDVVISAETNVSARLYIPKDSSSDHKLPLIIYFHGGGFISGSPFQEMYHNYLNSIVAEAKVVAVSVDYRLAPENPISTLYDDSWFALKRVASHYKGGGNEAWLKDYVDFERVFFGGDSAGGNIVHNMAMRCGSEKLDDVKFSGIFLINPYFFGKERIGQNEVKLPPNVIKIVENLWLIAGRMSTRLDDPRVDPLSDPKLSSLGGSKVLVSIAETDWLRHRGEYYTKALSKSGWGGVVDLVETKQKNHVFHLKDPSCEEGVTLLKQVASFINSK